MASAPPSAQLSRPLLPRVGRDAAASPVVDDVEEMTEDGGAGGRVGEEMRTEALVEAGMTTVEVGDDTS